MLVAPIMKKTAIMIIPGLPNTRSMLSMTGVRPPVESAVKLKIMALNGLTFAKTKSIKHIKVKNRYTLKIPAQKLTSLECEATMDAATLAVPTWGKPPISQGARTKISVISVASPPNH